MRNIAKNLLTINKAGKAVFKKANPKKEFKLTTDIFNYGSPEARTLLSLAFTLSFSVPDYAMLKGLIGLPYFNIDTQQVIDNGKPDFDAINSVIDLVATDVCKMEVDSVFHLSKQEILHTYNAAKIKAEAKAGVYKEANNMYADKFEIGSDA